jgi:hypothetical protein
MAQQIIDLIGIPGSVDHRRIPDEILGLTFYPLHASHVRALELESGEAFIAGTTPFRIRGVTYEPAEAVQAFFAYYAEHSDLVECNIKAHAA